MPKEETRSDTYISNGDIYTKSLRPNKLVKRGGKISFQVWAFNMCYNIEFHDQTCGMVQWGQNVPSCVISTDDGVDMRIL
jgi:hypothetical protein